MGTKKNTSIWIEPNVLKRLKHLAVEHGRPLGNIIAALIAVEEVQDDRELLATMLKQADNMEIMRTLPGDLESKLALQAVRDRNRAKHIIEKNSEDGE